MNNKYEKISLEELGILGDDVYNPTIYDEPNNIESLHAEVDKQLREGSYLEKVRFYNKGDRVQIAYNCSPGVKPIAGSTMYITECIYGDKPYEDCYKVSKETDDGIFWVVCHADIEGMWRDYEYASGGSSGVDRDGDTENRPVMDNTPIKKPECTHKIELRSFKRELVTYCTKCGKIFSARKKRK